MCIAYLALDTSPEWPLFIAANRDEYHNRPARMAAPWPQHPFVLGGIDLQAGGTWLGIDHSGRFALITNYRDPNAQRQNAPSRGDLARNFLLGTSSAPSYLNTLADRAHSYNGFNLIVGQAGQHVCYLGNRAANPAPQHLQAGRYVLSNHLLNTPWPKSQRLRAALEPFPQCDPQSHLDDIFQALKDTTQAHDHALPDTGLPTDRERLLSSPFIVSPNYGTRCSTVITVHASGRGLLAEVSYNAQGQLTGRAEWPFQVGPRGIDPGS